MCGVPVGLVPEMHGPLVGDRTFEVFFYRLTAHQEYECFHVAMLERGVRI